MFINIFSASLAPSALEKHSQQAKHQAQKHQFEGIGRKLGMLTAHRLEDRPPHINKHAKTHYYHSTNDDATAYAMIGGWFAHMLSPEIIFSTLFCSHAVAHAGIQHRRGLGCPGFPTRHSCQARRCATSNHRPHV